MHSTPICMPNLIIIHNFDAHSYVIAIVFNHRRKKLNQLSKLLSSVTQLDNRRTVTSFLSLLMYLHVFTPFVIVRYICKRLTNSVFLTIRLTPNISLHRICCCVILQNCPHYWNHLQMIFWKNYLQRIVAAHGAYLEDSNHYLTLARNDNHFSKTCISKLIGTGLWQRITPIRTIF